MGRYWRTPRRLGTAVAAAEYQANVLIELLAVMSLGKLVHALVVLGPDHPGGWSWPQALMQGLW